MGADGGRTGCAGDRGRETLTLDDTVAPHWLPLAAAGLVLASAAARHRGSLRAALASGLLVAAITRGLAVIWPDANLVPVGLHLAIGAMLVIAVLCDDWLADVARMGGAFLVLVLGVSSAVHAPMVHAAMPAVLVPWYPLFAVVTLFAMGFFARDRIYLAFAVANLVVWLIQSGSEAYQKLHPVMPGLDQIAWGMLFFLIAAAISLRKAGVKLGCRFRLLAALAARAWNRPRWNKDHGDVV